MRNRCLLLLLLTLGLTLLLAAAGAEENAFQPVDLPVISLHIDGGQAEVDRMNESENHSYRCTGTMDILIPEGYSGDLNGEYPQETLEGLKMEYIRGRGNGSWQEEKHPYKIKLEEKADLFGMGKNKHWALISNPFDNSLIRNRITFWLGEQLGLEYTPKCVFVELVMEGEYMGVYCLSETIRTGKNRVDIEELTEEDTQLPAIQGGYLLALHPDDWDSPNYYETSRGFSVENSTPSFDPEDGGYANDAQMNYIRDYIQRAEDAIYAEDGNYGDYLDLQSLADYWWIMEFSINADAYNTDSSHMFKDRTEADGSEGKLHFGPLWDFDEAWGNAELETTLNVGFNHARFDWMDALREKPDFRAYLEERWQAVDKKLEEMTQEGGVIDQLIALIADARTRDDAKWGAEREGTGLDVSRSLAEEVEHIRAWITLRREWISAHLDRLALTACTLTLRGEGLEEEVLQLRYDTWAELDMPEMDEEAAEKFLGWATEDGTLVEDRVWMDGDMVLTAVFAD